MEKEFYRQVLGGINAGNILDVGCREGYFIGIMLESFQSVAAVSAIDISDKGYLKEKDFFEKNHVDFKVMDGSNMEFKENAFDTVSISNSIHHLTDVMAVLSEMKRVMKGDGFFILNEMICDTSDVSRKKDVSVHHWFARTDSIMGTFHRMTYTSSELFGFVNSLGFGKIHIRYFLDDEYSDVQNNEKLIASIEKRLLQKEWDDDVVTEGRELIKMLKTGCFKQAPVMTIIARGKDEKNG